MSRIRPLPNKPLVEAIFEFRWQISGGDGDPHYPLFIGRLYDKVQSEYPFHEPLPSAMIPLPAATNLVQHRFRAEKDRWPLVQVGPGIVTVNDTEGYIWEDFGKRIKALIRAIYETYPEPTGLRVANLNLKYLDAFELEADQNMLTYLSDKLKAKVSLPSQLFTDTAVCTMPNTFNMMSSFATSEPKGRILVKFTSGKHADKPALVMELAVSSNEADLPKMPDEFEDWVESAHKLTDDWFFKFIEGELERRFAGE
ncbi:TIGR04255 family protein [Chloroflexota bacterium]